MRQIAREEIETAFAELAAVAERLGSKPEVRTEQHSLPQARVSAIRLAPTLFGYQGNSAGLPTGPRYHP